MRTRLCSTGALALCIAVLTGCGLGDTRAQAESAALADLQAMLDDFRAEFVERLDTNETAEELRTTLRTEPFGLHFLMGMSEMELRESFGEVLPALLDLSGSGDEIRLSTFFAASGQAGGGGSYEKLRAYVCADIVGSPGARLSDISTTLVPCSPTVRDALTRNNIDVEATPEQVR